MLSRSVVLTRPVASQFYRLFSSAATTSSNSVGVSKLDNGITVVSLDNDSEVSALGVFVKAGSRFESFDTNGSAHFIKHSAYQSTQSLSAIRITRLIESLSNNYSVDAGREGIQYKAETLRSQAPELLAILGDQMRPRLAEWEVRDQRERVMSDRNRLLGDAKSATSDAVHFTAYRGSGLGRPSIAPSFQIESLTHEALQQYVENEFVGNRIVVAGVGIDHETLVSNVTKSFGYLPAGTPQVEGASQYTGGESLSLGCGHGTRVSLAFNGVSFRSSEYVATHALALVLGGGNQSRGTPGSGLTSRLYQSLTQNPVLRAASTWNASYSDNGLFGLHGYATTGNATAVIELFAAQLRALKTNISDEEAARAVSLARAAVLSSTETRLGTIEFLGKQALAGNGTFVSPSDFVASPQFNVSSADLKKLASKILASSPTLVVAGDIAGIPTLDNVRQLL